MISALRKRGISTAKIAKQLDRHKSTSDYLKPCYDRIGALTKSSDTYGAKSSFISIFGTIKLSVEPYGNTYANPLRKGVKGITQKTAEAAWQQSVILPKDLQKLSIEKSPAIGKLIPSLAAEPSTVS